MLGVERESEIAGRQIKKMNPFLVCMQQSDISDDQQFKPTTTTNK